MSELDTSIRARFNDAAHKLQTLAFLARAIELQRDAVADAGALSAELALAKQNAILNQDEESANELLFMELALNVVIAQLRMCIALKEDAGEAAWDLLIDAQSACSAAIRVRQQIAEGPPIANLERLDAWLLQTEHLVFPPQSFLSIGGFVTMRECSICRSTYDACEHIKGRAYMGELCATVISAMDLDHVSLVDNPANKRARVTHFSDGTKKRNTMTWRLEDAP